jgi:translation elongation factor EF-Tu-like GTPase
VVGVLALALEQTEGDVPMAETDVGSVTRYFARIGVAGIKLTGVLSEGDTIHIVGHTTDHTQEVHSMQLENETITEGQAGQEIGLKVLERVRPGDQVYKVE